MKQLSSQYREFWESGDFQVLAFIIPSTNSTLHCQSIDGFKLLLRLSFNSPLISRYIKSYLQLCYCWNNYSLPFSLFRFVKWKTNTLLLTLKCWWDYLSKDVSNILKALIFGDHSFNDVKNTSSVLTASTEYLIGQNKVGQKWLNLWEVTKIRSD